jgi:hypothetical protein
MADQLTIDCETYPQAFRITHSSGPCWNLFFQKDDAPRAIKKNNKPQPAAVGEDVRLAKPQAATAPRPIKIWATYHVNAN